MARNDRFLTALCLMLTLAGLSSQAQAAVRIESETVRGVDVWFAQEETLPIVDIRLSFEGAGSVSDPEGKYGRASLAAGMLTEGAGALDSEAFQAALEDHAITLEFAVDEDRLNVHLRCLKEHTAKAAELLGAALSAPRFEPQDFTRVQAQLQSVITRQEESPVYLASRLLESHGFHGHPYANPRLGTAQTVAAITAQDLRRYVETYITRDNVEITAAGDVSADELHRWLSPVLDGLRRNDPGAVAVSPAKLEGTGDVLRASQPVPQTVIRFASTAVPRRDARFYAAFLLNHVLGGNALHARLSEALRQQQGLAYSASSELDTRSGVALFSGAVATRNSTREQALSALKDVFASLARNGVTPTECEEARSYVLGHFPLQLDGSAHISAILMLMQQEHLGIDYLDTRIAAIEHVRCEDLNALASELLPPERFLFAVVGGQQDGPAPAPVASGRGGDTR